MARLEVSVQPLDLSKVPNPMVAAWAKSHFAPAPAGVGRPDKLTLSDVCLAMGGKFIKEQVEAILVNLGNSEFCVSAWLLFIGCAPPAFRAWLVEQPLHRIPLDRWGSQEMGFFLDRVRQSGNAGGEHGAVVADLLRRVKSLSERNLDDADWEKEYRNKWVAPRMHWAPTAGGGFSRAKWLALAQKHCKRIAKNVIREVRHSGHLQTMEAWWGRRALWMPSGSSSERHRLDEAKAADNRLSSGDRPNKRAVAQAMSWPELSAAIDELGPSQMIRCSTKHEPGGKNRALYAGDDISGAVASYASQDIEKHMEVEGMVAKQAPSDVVDWLRSDLHKVRFPGAMWCSLDYSDFNSEHEKGLLAYLNLCFAEEWLLSTAQREECVDKAWAALWVAQSHMNTYVKFPGKGDDPIRQFHALNSGHRDTARDNTIMHAVYKAVVVDLMEELLGERVQFHYVGICGDDEDVLHKDWAQVVGYITMHQACGHALNGAKQEVDQYRHEFLQRQAVEGALPRRPLAPVLATLAGGNWYKEAGHHYSEALDGLSSSAWEVICRGGDPLVITRVICRMLDRAYTIPQREGKPLLLDWWRYRHSVESCPLWRNTPPKGDTEAATLPEIPEDFRLGELPQKATGDLARDRQRWLQALVPNQRAIWHQAVSVNCYKAFYGSFRERLRQAKAAEVWPLREGATEFRSEWAATVESVSLPELGRWIGGDGGERRPPSLEAALQRIDLDLTLFELIGRWRGVLTCGRPSDVRVFEHDIPFDEAKLPKWLGHVDPAISSWLRSRNY
jgi:hypothetical protein